MGCFGRQRVFNGEAFCCEVVTDMLTTKLGLFVVHYATSLCRAPPCTRQLAYSTTDVTCSFAVVPRLVPMCFSQKKYAHTTKHCR